MRRSTQRLLAPYLIQCAAYLVILVFKVNVASAAIFFGAPGGASGAAGLPIAGPTPVVVTTIAVTPTIYGGTAGLALTTGSSNSAGLVDTCASPNKAGSQLFACNNQAITPATVITFFFGSTTVDGVPSVTYVASIGGAATSITNIPSPIAIHNSLGAVQTTWGALCGYMAQQNPGGIDSTCKLTVPGTSVSLALLATITGTGASTIPGSTPAPATTATTDTLNFQVTVIDGDPLVRSDGTSFAPACSPSDPSSDVGVCHFELIAGDSSAKIQTLYSAASFPNLYTVPITNIIAVYAQGQNAFASIKPPSPAYGNNFYSMAVNPTSTTGNITLSPQIIPNLNNDTFYSVKIALQDAAGNIGFFTSGANDVTTTSPPTGDDYSCIFTSSPTGYLCHEPEPGAVVGVLSQNINCFIATAAYGSPLAPQIQILREFRDRIMIPTGWGRRFVRYYYKNGPIYARYIAGKDFLRALVRGALWPLVGFAHLALKIGFKTSILLVLAAMLVLFLMGRKSYNWLAVSRRKR